MELYREHIITMVKHLSQKRTKNISAASEERTTILTREAKATSISSDAPHSRRQNSGSGDASLPTDGTHRQQPLGQTGIGSLKMSVLSPALPLMGREPPYVPAAIQPVLPRTSFPTSQPLPGLSKLKASHIGSSYIHQSRLQFDDGVALPRKLSFDSARPSTSNRVLRREVSHGDAPNFYEYSGMFRSSFDTTDLDDPYVGNSSSALPSIPEPYLPPYNKPARTTSFTKMPTTFQEFIPQGKRRVKKEPLVDLPPYREPRNLAELREDAEIEDEKNYVLEQRKAYEALRGEHEFSIMTDEELIAHIPLKSQLLVPPLRAGSEEFRETLDPSNVFDYKRDEMETYEDHMNTWWFSGKERFMAAGRGYCADQISIASDKDAASVGIPLMAALFKSLSAYKESQDERERDRRKKDRFANFKWPHRYCVRKNVGDADASMFGMYLQTNERGERIVRFASKAGTMGPWTASSESSRSSSERSAIRLDVVRPIGHGRFG